MKEKRVYKHVIELVNDSKFTKIHYDFLTELHEILQFEGKRIASLLLRDIKLPMLDERVWDGKRKITVRKESY